MKVKLLIKSLFSAALILPLAAALVVVSPAMAADTWKIDPVHTDVVFAIEHLGVSKSHGRFNDVSGTIVLDEENMENSSVELEIKTASIDTRNEKRDEHLRGPDFFNAKQFPVITFKSTSIEKLGEAKGEKGTNYRISGELSMHGKTKPLTVTFLHMGTATNPRGQKVTGGTTSFTVQRSDFGIDYMIGPIGDEVNLIFSVEAIKQ